MLPTWPHFLYTLGVFVWLIYTKPKLKVYLLLCAFKLHNFFHSFLTLKLYKHLVVDAHIQFNESRYHVEENAGLVQPVLILSNQVSLLHDIVVTMRSIDKTATG